MNDFSPDEELNLDDPTSDDLMVSQVLDGLADARQLATVEDDPVLVNRLEVFRSISAQVGADVAPPGSDDRDAVIARALSELPVADEDGSDPTTVVDFVARQRKRSQLPRLLVAAVVTIALAIPAAVTLAKRVGDNRSGELIASSQTSPSPEPFGGASMKAGASDSTEDEARSEAAARPTSTTAQPDTVNDATVALESGPRLGVVSSPYELQEKIFAMMPGSSGGSPTVGAQSDSPSTTTTSVEVSDQTPGFPDCVNLATRTVGGDGVLTMIATADYMGSFAYVFVFSTTPASIVVVTTPGVDPGCSITATLTL